MAENSTTCVLNPNATTATTPKTTPKSVHLQTTTGTHVTENTANQQPMQNSVTNTPSPKKQVSLQQNSSNKHSPSLPKMFTFSSGDKSPKKRPKSGTCSGSVKDPSLTPKKEHKALSQRANSATIIRYGGASGKPNTLPRTGRKSSGPDQMLVNGLELSLNHCACVSGGATALDSGEITLEVPQLVVQKMSGHERSKSEGSHLPSTSSSEHSLHQSAVHRKEASESSNRSWVLSPGSEVSHDPDSSSSSVSHDAVSLSHDRALLLESLKSELLQQRTASDPTLLATAHQIATVDKDEIIEQLLEHIVSLKMELVIQKEENQKLREVRSTMDNEIHELTENLFEEAYKMVDDAKGGKVVAEKKLADATGKIDAMETEMSALKKLIQPHGEKHSLHPSHHKHKRPSVRKMVKKMTKKAGLGRSSSSKHHAASPITVLEHKCLTRGDVLVEGEPVQVDYEEFCHWLKNLSTSTDHPYLDKIIALDVRPCLSFMNTALSEKVLHAVENNDLSMEALTVGKEERRTCMLTGDTNICTHRVKLGESDEWQYISQQSRDRIVAACDFYMYIGHIKRGILKIDPTKLYWQVARLRAMMNLARLTLSLPEEKHPL